MRTGRNEASVVAAVALCLAAAAQADVLVKYDFEGSSLEPVTVHGNISASDMGYDGDGTTGFYQGYPDAGTAWGSTKWPTNGTPDDYFGFTITIPTGFVGEVTSLSFAEKRSDKGPTNWVVRYSTNGTTFADLGEGDSTSADVWHTHTADDVRPLDLIGTVHLRVYGIRAATNSGTWRVDDVTLNGMVSVDDGTRAIRYQSFDGSAFENWGSTTTGGGSVVTTNSRSYAGAWSREFSGTDGGGSLPVLTFDNVSLAGMTDVALSVAYAAQDVDTNDNFLLSLSYDGGSDWNGTGGVTLVYGYDNGDVAFGETLTSPLTASANPYTFELPASETQVALRFEFFDFGTAPSSNDFYYIDDVRLTGIPVPSADAPTISNCGGITGISATTATIRGHVTSGYPYPEVTVYWGPSDGGENSSNWSHEVDMGTQSWGVFETTLTDLSPGQVYYYRCFASNAGGSDWADSTTNFTTTAASVDNVTRRMYVDTLGIASDMPLHIDRDGNGLSDRWEEDYLGGTGSDKTADKDGDGVSNHREYLAGTDPDDLTSYMTVLTVDLADPTSSDIEVTWQAGDHISSSSFQTVGDSDRRKYRVFAANNDASLAKSLRTTVTNDGSATHIWTDTSAVDLYASRFYNMGVTLGGESYTNTEEWAVFVQDRLPTNRYLICVPVNFANASSNNFNSQLGEQLARGLYAGFTTGDVVRLWDDSKAWINCLLTTNAQGDVQWWTNGVAMDLEVSPGRAMWVERSSSSAPRANTVFAGRTFSGAEVTSQSFTTDNGRWNLFGWPLPIARTHDSGGAGNQLGFADIGTGGIPYHPDNTNHGDEIWMQHGNGFRFYQLLDNHAAGGEDLDRRWWGNGTGGGGLADFSLEPGRGYYYYHTTNWSATNFIWTPSAP